MSEALRLAEESTNLAERRLESDGYEWSVDADVQLRETAAELRRLAPMEAEVSQLRADANTCGSGAGCCYQAAQNERLDAELQQARAELTELRAQVESWREHCDTLTHQVICCGVAASHPDATLTTRGAYAGKWNSAQAEEVRQLRIDRDKARAELAALRAVPAIPDGWRLVPSVPTSEMIDAAGRSKAIDDEGEFPSLYDHIDYSGDNKTRAVIRASLTAALSASPQAPQPTQP